MVNLNRVLMVVAVVCLIAAAFGIAAPVHLGWLGLACWAMTALL